MISTKNIYLSLLIIIIIVIIYILLINETVRDELFSWILKTPIEAIAVFDDTTKGSILFKEDLQASDIIIEIKLHTNLPDGKYGLTIYQLGDITPSNDGFGEHFNPYSKLHGDINSGHIGDLGNIEFKNGASTYTLRSPRLHLRGTHNIAGRCIAIHENEDDLGDGNDPDSKKNGGIGEAISVAVIGYSKV